MKYIFSLLLSLFALCSFSTAQDFHLYLTGGVINYQGDLQAKRFTLNQSHPFAAPGCIMKLQTNFTSGWIYDWQSKQR